MHKTTLKKGGTATGTRIFNMLQTKGVEIKDPVKQNEILSAIDSFIKTENIHTQDTGVIGRKTNELMGSINGSLDSGIEVIGKWLIPGKPSTGKKNMSEVVVYFFPSLVKSRPGDKNPKLRHGSIMIKTNNQYADISNYVRSMTRDTDDMLAEMVRGASYPLGRKPYHIERFNTSERLDDGWTYTPKGDAAINLMAEKTVNDLKAELDAKKAELDTQKKELQKAKENKESHEKSAKDLKKELAKVNEDLKKNKGNEAKIQELTAEKEKIKIELATAKTDLETSKTSIKEGNAALESTKKVLEAAKSEVDSKNNENKDLKSNLGKLEKEKDDLIKEKEISNKLVSELQEKSREQESKLAESSKKFGELQNDKNKLLKELSQLTSRSDATSKESINTIQSKLTRITTDLEKTKNDKIKLEQSVANVNAKLVEATNQAAEKSEALSLANTDLDNIKKTQAATNALNISAMNELRQKLQNEIKEKSEKDKELEEKALIQKKLEEQLQKLTKEKDELSSKNQATEQIQSDLNAYKTDLEDARRKKMELEKRFTTLSQTEEQLKKFNVNNDAFKKEEREQILRRIIAEKILHNLKERKGNGITVTENFIIPDNILTEINNDIQEYRTAGNKKTVNQELLKRFNNAYLEKDTETNLKSITFKLSSGDIDEKSKPTRTYAQKYTDLFISAMNPKSARGSVGR